VPMANPSSLNPPVVPALTLECCHHRQARLREALHALDLRGAVITDRRHVHYFTGHWSRFVHNPVVWIDRDGPTILALPGPADHGVAAEEICVYPSNDDCTLVDDQRGSALHTLQGAWVNVERIGCDGPLWPQWTGAAQVVNLMDTLRTLRRCKDADEVALLSFALDASEKAYAHARQIIKPGLDETELWAQLQYIIAEHIGETTGELGNDFQVGAIGNAPRRREMQTGEIAIIDLGVMVRGYNGDMCRSIVVGGEPSPKQERAHQHILEAIAFIEATVKPGISCKSLFAQVQMMLDGFEGFSFRHHLGHGIGMNPHEAPRLNRLHDDHFAIGDLFTAEPGLYGHDLRAGIRIEHAYHLTKHGLVKLTNSTAELV